MRIGASLRIFVTGMPPGTRATARSSVRLASSASSAASGSMPAAVIGVVAQHGGRVTAVRIVRRECSQSARSMAWVRACPASGEPSMQTRMLRNTSDQPDLIGMPKNTMQPILW